MCDCGGICNYLSTIFEFGGNENVSIEKKGTFRPVSYTHLGEAWALVGPSGGGKTTIARLIPRFFDVQAGAVLLGGRDVHSIPTAEDVYKRQRSVRLSTLDETNERRYP